MRITIVGTFPPYRGGISHFNSVLAQTLSKNHTVKAVNFTTQYPEWLFPGKTQYETGTGALYFPNDRLLSSVNLVSWKRTANFIIRQNPEVVIYKYWMPFFAPVFGRISRLVKKRVESKVLIICDNVIPHEAHWYDTALTRYFFNIGDYFIVMSKSVEKDLIKLFPNARFKYLPHPIYNIFGESIDKQEAKTELGIFSEKVILYFGYIREYKGLDILIRASSLLKESFDDFTVLAVGECYENPDKYIQMIKEYQVEDVFDLRMEFVPDIEIKKYFSAADVVALPYKSATQSGIVQIAYHFNRPVIVTNVGGLPEIVPNGEVGFVVPPERQAVAKAIERFYTDDLSETFYHNLKEYKKRFSWQSFVLGIQELVF